jgi:hypothetical protein
MILTNKGNAIISASSVIVDFNVLTTRDIVGHNDIIYGDIISHNGVPTLLISATNEGGMQRAMDRRSVAQRTEHTTGQHAFSIPGKRAAAAGVTHARYTLGEPENYMAGVTAYPLEFNSEVHPGEIVKLANPGVTIAYPSKKSQVGETVGDGKSEEHARAKIKAASDQQVLSSYYHAKRYIGEPAITWFKDELDARGINPDGENVDEAVLPGGERSRKGGWPSMIDNDSTRIYNDAIRFMKNQVEKYQKYVAGQDSIPAGPDSSKFSATRSGMIEFAKDTQVHGGTYGFNRFYQAFVKIGGNVDGKIKQKMREEFKAWLTKTTGDDSNYYMTPVHTITYGEVDGTNWGGYGLEFKATGDYEYYKKSMTPQATVGESAEAPTGPAVAWGRSAKKHETLAKRAREAGNEDLAKEEDANARFYRNKMQSHNGKVRAKQVEEGWFTKDKLAIPSQIAKAGDTVTITKTHPRLDIIPGDQYQVKTSDSEGVTIDHGLGTIFRDIKVPHSSYKVRAKQVDEAESPTKEYTIDVMRDSDEKWVREKHQATNRYELAKKLKELYGDKTQFKDAIPSDELDEGEHPALNRKFNEGDKVIYAGSNGDEEAVVRTQYFGNQYGIETATRRFKTLGRNLSFAPDYAQELIAKHTAPVSSRSGPANTATKDRANGNMPASLNQLRSFPDKRY